jgi:Leucine-rich repeat (LRR) protein
MVILTKEEILTCFDVFTQELKLSKRNVEVIETNTFNIDEIKNVKTLDLSDNDISNVFFEAFSSLPNLENILLCNNKIPYLADDLFLKCEKIKKLSLADNSINSIKRNTLVPLLKTLEFLDLSNNQILDLGEKTFKTYSSFNYNSNLEILKLSNNYLKKLNVINFKGLSNLVDLDLSGNKVTQIDKGTFEHLKNLKELNLAKNEISVISDESFKDLSRLENLNLSENKLELFSTKDFNNYPKESDLADFGQKNEKLKQTGKKFSGLKNLKTLNLSMNKIKHTDSDTFVDLENLQTLLIFANDLKQFEFASLKNSKKIQTIDISQNKIAKINFQSNADQNFVGAMISKLKSSNSFDELRTLKMYANKVQNLDGLSSLINLEALKLDYYDMYKKKLPFPSYFEVISTTISINFIYKLKPPLCL